MTHLTSSSLLADEKVSLSFKVLPYRSQICPNALQMPSQRTKIPQAPLENSAVLTAVSCDPYLYEYGLFMIWL